ncbi:Rieske (2Fe-2S) protein [Desmospora profundinema]|uniref:Nitrite reductase/ring-hydroxylating ferredoxin subunit n=1 Tax=Desmospora profundinema TaxID=1571184 RepID=A0ABU1INA4_9BACL|nr:Rieske 2Fe-2S domain-containing protein [Desmospora profundinema]MDR6226257.1 nitrite reductase/ring-hydroxylating ferredoxin subunit [Desmospora profundinema]
MATFIKVSTLTELKKSGVKVVKGEGNAIAVVYHEGRVYAVDNRCPHMGFPLHMGSLCDGILTCHWHHARFDLDSGGTLDPWADDVATYRTEIRDGVVWVESLPQDRKRLQHHRDRLREGLEQNLSLVIAKAVVALMEGREEPEKIAAIGVEFGTTHRRGGWRSGLTILSAMVNLLPKLDRHGQVLALYQGLRWIAAESAGMGTRFQLEPLPLKDGNPERLARWYRRCVEVRDVQGAERVLLTAIRAGLSDAQLSEWMMAAVTDHFYMDVGHVLDFHNKGFEILTKIGSDHRERVLSSLLPQLAGAERSEELHSWQSPVDLVAPLKRAFAEMETFPFGTIRKGEGDERLVETVLGEDPQTTVTEMTRALREGMDPRRLAQLVTLAAATRIRRFHVQNDFRDWDTALHTFTHAHAVHESLHRSVTPELVRGVFHAAMSVYLDRFLNIPAAKEPKGSREEWSLHPDELLSIMDKQQQVTEAAQWVQSYLDRGGDKDALFRTLGHALLREDAEFHTFQMVEAAVVEYDRWEKESGAMAQAAQETMILAMTRYLAAHAPTAREVPHVARIAWRLHRGEMLFEEEAESTEPTSI